MLFEIDQIDERWSQVDLGPLAKRAASATFAHLGIPDRNVELSLLACDDTRIADLNRGFRDKPTPTNVLSWPVEDLSPPDLPAPDPDGTLSLGDIAIAFDTCAQEAADAGKSLPQHTAHLIVHAVLHLLGYDHIDEAEAETMERLETEILGKLGLPDPYS